MIKWWKKIVIDINKCLYFEKNFNHLKLTRAISSPNVHWRANQACSWLLRTLSFCIICIHQLIHQRLFLSLYNTHPTWLSLTNELKFDEHYQINLLSLINLLLLIIKFAFNCEGRPYKKDAISYSRNIRDAGSANLCYWASIH